MVRAAGRVGLALALLAGAGCGPHTRLPGVAGHRAIEDHLPAPTPARMAAIAQRFDPQAAMDLVVFMDRFWRNAGNAGFNASIDRIQQSLMASGFSARGSSAKPAGARRPEVWTESFGAANGWDHTVGTLTLLGEGGAPDEVLLSREQHRVALCINSFSTPEGGAVARVVDVGAGIDAADYAGRDVRGAIVLGDGGIGRLWRAAVVERGAIGVISTELEDYIRPVPATADAAVPPREQWDVLQWSSVPYDETRKGFGFKATPRAAARVRARLAQGPVRLRADVSASFAKGPVRSLVAEIPGRSRANERIVLVAHIQEPGANDDASGCATLLELARALEAGVRAGELPAPERTLTFLWVDEIRGSRQWLADHPAEARSVRFMISLDMTGEDTTKTGGTFLIEKAPDPAAVWDRPSDPHTEWGSGHVRAESLRGTLLNDLFLAVCRLRARDTGWTVRTNPYEGGSDHAVFLAAGVPSLLAWHFPDRFYHSNLDRPEMTSPITMTHVGVSAATTALLLATASEQDAADVVALLAFAARERLALERTQGRTIVERAADRAAAEVVEGDVRRAWVSWYRQALDDVTGLPVTGSTPALTQRIERSQAGLGEPPRAR